MDAVDCHYNKHEDRLNAAMQASVQFEKEILKLIDDAAYYAGQIFAEYDDLANYDDLVCIFNDIIDEHLKRG